MESQFSNTDLSAGVCIFFIIVWIASNQEKVQGVYEKFIILLGGRYFSGLR